MSEWVCQGMERGANARVGKHIRLLNLMRQGTHVVKHLHIKSQDALTGGTHFFTTHGMPLRVTETRESVSSAGGEFHFFPTAI